MSFDFEKWFCEEYAATYKGAKDLLRAVIGPYKGDLTWKKAVIKDLKDPSIYFSLSEKLGRAPTFAENCEEALERLRADMRYRRKLKQDEDSFKADWELPLISSYLGKEKKSHLQDIPSISENVPRETSGVACKCGGIVEIGSSCIKCYDKRVIHHDKTTTGRKIDSMADRLRDKFREMQATGTQKQQMAATKAYLQKPKKIFKRMGSE